MPNLQVKGPRSTSEGAVQYHTVFSRSQGQSQPGLMVTIRVGDRLRQCVNAPEEDARAKRSKPDHAEVNAEENAEANTKASGTQNSPAQIHTPGVSSLNNVNPTSSPAASTTETSSDSSSVSESSEEADISPGSDSDIEIVEVRNAPPRGNSFNATSTQTPSQLLARNVHIPEALRRQPDIVSQLAMYSQQHPRPAPHSGPPPIHALHPEFFQPHVPSTEPPPPGYRNIPVNLYYAIYRELKIWNSPSADDDIEMVEKLVFSLLDPILKTKIQLPIKSTVCTHFECFDFNIFCDFNGLKPGVRESLKNSLMQQSSDARRREKLFATQQQRIYMNELSPNERGVFWPSFNEHGQMFFTELYNRSPPLYKCPLCDSKFGLKQLYISDIFNYFVRTTPRHINKVQIEDRRFKIIEDSQGEDAREGTEVVDILDSESDGEGKEEKGGEGEGEGEGDDKGQEENDTEREDANGQDDTEVDGEMAGTNGGPGARGITAKIEDRTSDDLNDDLDEMLSALGANAGSVVSTGDGSWEHPLTLD